MKAGPGLLPAALESWRFRYTPAGRAMLVAVFVAGLAGSVTVSVPIHHIFTGVVILYAVCLAFGSIFGPRLLLSVELPDRVTAGAPFAASVSARPAGRAPVFDAGFAFRLPRGVEEMEPPPLHASVAPGRTVVSSAVLVGRRRGRYALPGVVPYTLFPFGIYRIPGRQAGPFPLLVVPRYAPLSGCDVPFGRRYQPGGIAYGSEVGESPEYFGNREYRPGDPTRRIDFRSWARLARPVVKEFREEYFARLALVLDTGVPARERPGPDGFPNLEAAVSLTAAVAEFLERREYILDIFAAGPELHVFRTGRSIGYLDSVLEILASVDACRGDPLEAVGPALLDEIDTICGVILVLLDWDGPRAAFVRKILEAGGTPKVVVVRDGPTTLPPALLDDWGVAARFVPASAVNRGETDRL